ncbi:MAG TPA: asparagine synthetase B [Croceibacterium sp.]
MTALAGIWRFDGDPAARQSCARMLSAQAIYGPHGADSWADGGIALGRALFRSLSGDRFDRQPLSGAGDRLRLVADVRLDNRDELAEALGLDGAAARTMADAQFLLGAWERWEERAFDRLVGDYAFAIWDAAARHLVLARDPLGMRPLHYHRAANFVAFASMPKGLHALPEVPYAPDEATVTDLLALLPEAGPGSYFAGISRVEPGHFVTIGAGGTKARRHWQPVRTTFKLASSEAYAEALRDQLDRAVAARLRGADGRIASHLSGGRDSGAVTAAAARLLAPSGGTVTAFTSVPREGYEEPDPDGRFCDEGPLAAATAALQPNVAHVLVRTDKPALFESLDRDFYLFERPILNLCNQHWASAINDAARERGLTILLSGQMGNMTISYSGMEWLAQLAGQGRWLRLMRESRALVRVGRTSWPRAALTSLGPWLPMPMWRLLRRTFGGSADDLASFSAINPHQRSLSQIDARARACGVSFPYRPQRDPWQTRVSVLQRVDPGNYLKGVLGGWQLDIRDPTADRRLIEFCLSVPAEQYLQGGQPAALAARAFAGRLPPAVLEGRRRGLQGADWHVALTEDRAGLRRELARFAELPAARRLLDLARIGELEQNWPAGDWNGSDVSAAYRILLLRATSIGHFLRKASASNA